MSKEALEWKNGARFILENELGFMKMMEEMGKPDLTNTSIKKKREEARNWNSSKTNKELKLEN